MKQPQNCTSIFIIFTSIGIQLIFGTKLLDLVINLHWLLTCLSYNWISNMLQRGSLSSRVETAWVCAAHPTSSKRYKKCHTRNWFGLASAVISRKEFLHLLLCDKNSASAVVAELWSTCYSRSHRHGVRWRRSPFDWVPLRIFFPKGWSNWAIKPTP